MIVLAEVDDLADHVLGGRVRAVMRPFRAITEAGQALLFIAALPPVETGPVTLTDILSAGLGRVGTPSTNNGVVTLVNASTSAAATTTLQVGQTLTMVIQATVSATTGTMTNTAVGTSTTPDPVPNNTVTVATPVLDQASLTLTKVISTTGSATAGSTVTYTVALVNLGPSAAQNVTLTDILSAGLGRVGTPSTNNGAVTLVNASTSVAATTTLSGSDLDHGDPGNGQCHHRNRHEHRGGHNDYA